MTRAASEPDSSIGNVGAEPRPGWEPSRGLIPRDRLIERLRGWHNIPMVLSAAPAGYGKTTVLAEWEAADPRPFAWIAIDARHNDPAFMAAAIATGLDALEPIDPRVFDALGSARPGLSHALTPRLADEIASRSRRFVLVLDDVHLLREQASLDLIAALCERLPTGCQFALASRLEPSLPLGRLRSQGKLAELGPLDLAMTGSETAAMLGLAGVEVGADSVRHLLDRTEGWPVAVYLAALSLADADDSAAAIERFRGDDRLMADYLRDEMISILDAEDLEFMVSCSVLEQLTGPLCDVVLELEGSAETLRRLSRSNLLVIPLDRADREFRYHALLREMLSTELERGGESPKAGLHARAAAWYEERGDYDRAIPHAIASGDLWAAGSLIWTASPIYESHGRDATLQRLLDEFTETEIASCPPLALARATSHVTRGEGAEADRWTSAAIARVEEAPVEIRQLLQANARLLRSAGSWRGPIAAMGREVAAARELIPDASSWTSLAYYLEGTAQHLCGRPTEGRRLLEEGSTRASAAPNVRTLCLAQLALLCLEQEDESAAWRLEEQSAAVVERYGLGDFATEALVLAVRALIRARRGRVDEAAPAARQASRLLDQLPGISAWYEAESRLVLARALLLLDDVAGARIHIAGGEGHLQAIPDAPVLTSMLTTVSREAEAAGAAEGHWPLTPAELRLLHQLPTHHSFREIAARLFVSTNTVKSQARSIYRKLGVASRGEAVACAQAAGLIARPSAASSQDRSVRA